MKARSLQGHYAGLLSRGVGFFIDYLIVIALAAGAIGLTLFMFKTFGVDLRSCSSISGTVRVLRWVCAAGALILVLEFLLIGPLYYVLCWSLVGQTIGQRVMGVRVVALDGRSINVVRSFVRFIGYQLCTMTLGIGFLWVLIDDRRMGWHDKLARTCVVYAWKAEQNEGFVGKVNRRFFGNRREDDGLQKTHS